MRIIKFRVWDKKLKQWNECGTKELKEVYAWDTEGIGLNDLIDFISKKDDGRFIISQYTGLKDKNDKEIYEGDIVKLTGIDISGSRITEVVFDRGSFREKYMGYNLDCYKDYEIEIIGNI